MQNKIVFLLFYCLFYCLFALASFAQKKALPLTGSVLFGVLEGEQGNWLQLGATGGVKLKSWTTSIGTGLDYYGVRSIPLYLNVEKRILSGGGYNFPWLKANNNSWWNDTRATGGVYYGAGIGYQVPASRQIALFFAAGYSFKQFRQEITQRFECVTTPCPDYKEKIEYGLRRLSVTTGLRF
jgi:hypothetical protein